VGEADKPPDERKDEPTEREGEHKVEQVPAPLDVDKCREDVGHVPLPSLLDVCAGNVTLAVLVNKTLIRPLAYHVVVVVVVRNGVAVGFNLLLSNSFTPPTVQRAAIFERVI